MTRPAALFGGCGQKSRYECYIPIYWGRFLPIVVAWAHHAPRSERTNMLFRYYSTMTKISVEVPDELLTDLDAHVGAGKKFVNRSEAVRASIRKTLDQLDEIDARQGRIDDE